MSPLKGNKMELITFFCFFIIIFFLLCFFYASLRRYLVSTSACLSINTFICHLPHSRSHTGSVSASRSTSQRGCQEPVPTQCRERLMTGVLCSLPRIFNTLFAFMELFVLFLHFLLPFSCCTYICCCGCCCYGSFGLPYDYCY